MTRIEGRGVRQSIGSLQNNSHLAWYGCYDATIGIDGSSHSCIGITQQPSRIFDRAQASLCQVLRIRATIAVPAIVRNIHEYLGPVGGKLPDFIGKNGFIANENSDLVFTSLQGRSRRASGKVTDLLGESSSEAEYTFEGNIFAERDKMHFVVTPNPFARRTD